MGTLKLRLFGANAYVPHTDGKALLVVLPNASHLGTSPTMALDGTPLPQHVPMHWNFTTDLNGNFSVTRPELFLGSRLIFQLGGTPTPLDLSAISPLVAQGWLEVDPALLNVAADDRLAGQILIQSGVVSAPMTGCNKAWSRTFNNSLDSVVPELQVLIQGVSSIKVTALRWVGTGSPKDVFDQPTVGAGDTVELRVGNFCAGDALGWPRNSDASGRVHDADFKWIYALSKSASLPTWINGGLPVPVVDGSAILENDSPSFAFGRVWGGGGGAGCQCNGCIERPANFIY